jgi:hypothetical protein
MADKYWPEPEAQDPSRRLIRMGHYLLSVRSYANERWTIAAFGIGPSPNRNSFSYNDLTPFGYPEVHHNPVIDKLDRVLHNIVDVRCYILELAEKHDGFTPGGSDG